MVEEGGPSPFFFLFIWIRGKRVLQLKAGEGYTFPLSSSLRGANDVMRELIRPLRHRTVLFSSFSPPPSLPPRIQREVRTDLFF